MEKAAFRNFLTSNDTYLPDNINHVLDMVTPYIEWVSTNTKIKYLNIPISFDIETTSFYRSENEKVAIMYEWSLGIFGMVIIGRTWETFLETIEYIVKKLKVTPVKRIIVYIHNLSYEFQFMRKWFDWQKVFSLDSRKPVYALTSTGIEFRCSYILSGYSLEKVGEHLTEYHIQKLIGYLDYSKIRHSKTTITAQEIEYCANDVRVVMAYIAERIEGDGNISRIPLTKTGYVRRFCKNSCFYEAGKPRKKSFKRKNYVEIMKGLRLTADEYKALKAAFQGGFTHANPFFAGKVVEGVTSFDFTSSYPFVMLSEMFPMSSSERVEIRSKEELYKNLRLYCCLFDIEFIGLESKVFYESYLSLSRCHDVKNATVNNGRIVRAEHLITTITEQDFLIIKKFYTWEHMRIGTFRRYKKGYLPTDFVKAILKLYSDKTTLKDVEGKEVEYLHSKEMLNSCYGMAVTDIVRDKILYTDDWQDPEKPDIEKVIAKYNNSASRFLFYPWGVWVTAYARRNLFSGICEFAEDYLYSDTDSIKVRNVEKHMVYIEKYNRLAREQLYKAMDFHGIDRGAIEPATIEGKKKCLGVWDFDGHYKQFKTLGAKRYLVQYSDDTRNSKKKRGTYSLTVSGLNKKKCVPYLLDKYGEDGIFEAFTQDLYIPHGKAGKNTYTYIDDDRKGVITDYNGVPGEYHEKTSVHLEPADYSLKLSREYINYLLDIDTIEI